jgi:epoxyqueuosine reductase
MMPEARSLIILGKVLWDEGMNLSVSSAGQADFSGGGTLEYYNFYYNLVENLAWRFSSEMSARYGAKAVPTVTIHLKVSAMLAGLGWIGHNTLVITPDYGPRVRWVGVLTDMELEPDRPFDEDLCAKQEKCRERDRCVRACPYKAIIPGPSQGVEPGKKVDQDMCVVMHVFDPEPTEEYERHIRRVTPRGMMECTLCNLSCPYGDRVEREIIPARRGLAPGSALRRGSAGETQKAEISPALSATFGQPPEPVKYPPALAGSMKCPVCGRDPGLNPFSICQFCGNALQQDEEDANRDVVQPKKAYTM